jgi:hypothetical protein
MAAMEDEQALNEDDELFGDFPDRLAAKRVSRSAKGATHIDRIGDWVEDGTT